MAVEQPTSRGGTRGSGSRNGWTAPSAGAFRSSVRRFVPDVGGGAGSCRGFVIPIGLNGEAGALAVARERSDFPTATDQLLLSLAANQAGTAFQSARLVHERKRAEDELREAQDELELKVAERTAELRRSEAHLTEAQRLTHTGSFAIDVSTREVTHSSAEYSRLYGFDPEQGIPSLSEFLQRIHPQDRARCTEALERGIREATKIEADYRVVLPRSPVRHHLAIAHPVFNASGELDEIVGTIVDVTERSQAETELQRLAGEQAALWRVATIVAREASQAEVFTAIAEEIGQLLGTEEIRMLRYEDDRSAVVVASWGQSTGVLSIGSRLRLEDDSATSRVFRTGQPARIDDYARVDGPIAETARSAALRCAVATPILVEGRLWGAMTAGTNDDEPLPAETEARLGQFTELMATAIANTEARAEVERLAEEQAALRRVATLVAEGASPTAVFESVAAEMEGLLDADQVALGRYEPGAEVAIVAYRGPNASRMPPGIRMSLDGDSVMAHVRRTERPARMDYAEQVGGPIREFARNIGVHVSVGAPIVVDGRLWGAVQASWIGEEPPPADTEKRMAQFAQLLDTAIANADSRDQLTASRARLLTEGDEARRRVVRDLHDGAQQRLVHTIITLKLAQRAFGDEDGKAASLVGEALEHAQQGNAELRELVHGILPAVLTHSGLWAGVNAFVARLDLRVGVDVSAERFPAEIEASAYFIVAEALTNVVKHAHAERAQVRAFVEDGLLRIEVRDDGIGGADPSGHGLVGMGDRVTALGGRLEIESPAGGGTLVAATLPLSAG
jgi:signal transduction histidine kinase/PAS domain-containing protein